MKSPTISVKLRDEFIRQVRGGRWPVGAQIPTEMELAQRYGASRTAVRRALKLLEEKGWLRSTQGSGRVVQPECQQWGAVVGLFTLGGGELSAGQGSRYFAAIESELTGHGHNLVSFAYAKLQAQTESPIRRRLRSTLLDGAIVFATQYQPEFVSPLAKRIPVISLPHDLSTLGVPSFFVDYGLHAAVAVRELVALGHRRIALLLADKPDRAAVNGTIRRGFDLGRLNGGLPADPRLVLFYPPTQDEALYRELYRQCRAMDPPVTAMLALGVRPLIDLVHHAQRDGAGDGWIDRVSMACLADPSDHGDLPYPIGHFSVDVEHVVHDAIQHLHAMFQGAASAQLHHPYYGVFKPGAMVRPAP